MDTFLNTLHLSKWSICFCIYGSLSISLLRIVELEIKICACDAWWSESANKEQNFTIFTATKVKYSDKEFNTGKQGLW